MAKSSKAVSTSEVVSSVASHFTELPKRLTKEVITDFLASVEREVVSGNKVRLDKIGILQTRDRGARKGRNPQTGEEIMIPASKKVSFRVAKSLKDQVVPARAKKKK